MDYVQENTESVMNATYSDIQPMESDSSDDSMEEEASHFQSASESSSE